jgi:superfamily II DNA/RNA helicase
MQRDPVRVAVTPAATTVETVSQRVIHVDRAGKPTMLADLLHGETIDRALVFTRTKHGADKVVRGLVKSGIAAQAIHGNKSQNQRERVLADFRAGKIRTLVATDIAARGIDVDGISHVINYDLPNIPESYVHRIGRTARAGAAGIAISFCDRDEMPFLRDIEKLIGIKLATTGQFSAPRGGAPTPHHRPQQNAGRPGQHQRGRHQQRGNQGKNAQGRNGHGKPGGQQRRGSENRHAPVTAQSSPESIATVAFMRQPEPRRQNTGDNNRNAR